MNNKYQTCLIFSVIHDKIFLVCGKQLIATFGSKEVRVREIMH
jgi:hypothetical protein